MRIMKLLQSAHFNVNKPKTSRRMIHIVGRWRIQLARSSAVQVLWLLPGQNTRNMSQLLSDSVSFCFVILLYLLILGIVSEGVHGKPVNSFQAFTKSGVQSPQWIVRSMKTSFEMRKIPRAPQMKV